MYTRCLIKNVQNVKYDFVLLFALILLMLLAIISNTKEQSYSDIQQKKENNIEDKLIPLSGIGSKQWLSLLKAFEIHDEKSKKIIEEIANKTNSSLEKDLAKELISNWDLSANSKYLKNAHPINQINNYLLTEKAEKIHLNHIIIGLNVDSIGKVKSAKVIWPKNMKDDEIPVNINKFKDYICRPSFKKGKFVSGDFSVVINIDHSFIE